MKRVLRHLLFAFALLFAQQAAQLHDFSHLPGAAQKGAPATSHLAAKCLTFHAVGSALPCGAIAVHAPRIEPRAPVAVALPLSRAVRVAFDSRAPPSSS